MPMGEYSPTFAAVGVPDSRPVAWSKFSHEGLSQIMKASFRPLGSRAVGWNEYTLPIVAIAGGLPPMTGGVSGSDTTFRVNEGRQLRHVPLLTQMTMPLKVAVWVAVPASCPVAELKVAHQGLLVIEKVAWRRRKSRSAGTRTRVSQ